MAHIACCNRYALRYAECPIHGDSEGRFFRFASSNEQNVKPEENKASYRQHSFVEYAENPEVTYTHRPLVG